MFDPKKLEQVAKQIHDAMPQPVKDLGADVDQKVRQVIQGQLNKLDVVSREEFDVQTQVLLRTRQKPMPTAPAARSGPSSRLPSTASRSAPRAGEFCTE